MGATCLATGCQHKIVQKALGGTRLYCSDKCRWAKRRKPESDKICIICNKPFRTNRCHTKCCSKKCSIIREKNNARLHQKRVWERKKANKVPVIRNCLYCQKGFKVTKYKRKYCSKECRYKAILMGMPKRVPIEKICPVCGNYFIPKKNNGQKYCSDKCKIIYIRKIYKERPVTVVEKQCINKKCNKKFTTTKPNLVKYCSDKCRKIMADRRQIKINRAVMKTEDYRYYKALYRRLGTLRPDLRSRYWELLGLSNKKELLVYINKIKKPGMTIKNRGSANSHEEWQLDHKVPFSSINLLNDEEFKKVFHHSNLQCLWGDEHYDKTYNEK